MPTLELEGIGKVHVDDGFTNLSAQDQEKTINEIIANFGGGKQRPRQMGFVESALNPITSYPETYREMNLAGQNKMAEGISSIKEGLALPHGPEGAGKFIKGIGNTALGALEYGMSPINAAYRSIIGRPVENATGIPKEYTEFAAQLGTPGLGFTRLSRAPQVIANAERTPPIPPSREELFKASEEGYNKARHLDVMMDPRSTERLAGNIDATLEAQGFRDYLTPKTFRAADELRTPTGVMEVDGARKPASTISDVESVRKALRRASGDPNEAASANKAIEMIDTYFENLAKSRPAVFGEGTEAGKILKEARANFAAAKRSEAVDKVGYIAELNASSAGSGANINNATRQAIKSVLRNPEKLRGFSEAEIAQMEKIVKGTATGNLARRLGKLAPTDIVSAGASGGGGYALGGAAGTLETWGLGFAAKKLADHITKREYNKLDAMIRSRSPLGQQMEAPLRKWVEAGNALSKEQSVPMLVKFQLASANLANNLKDIGIRIDPSDLLKTLQGPMRAPAETEQQ